jgi:hypothetical protein
MPYSNSLVDSIAFIAAARNNANYWFLVCLFICSIVAELNGQMPVIPEGLFVSNSLAVCFFLSEIVWHLLGA